MTFDTMANNKIQRSQNHGLVFARGTANKVYVDQRVTCLLFWPADLVRSTPKKSNIKDEKNYEEKNKEEKP